MHASLNVGYQGKSGPSKIHEVILVNYKILKGQKSTRLWFPSNVLGQRYAKYLPSTTKYIRAVKYQTLDILWHAAINVHRAWLVMIRRVTGVRNMTLSDTPRFPTCHVPICDSSGIVKYPGSKSSTKLLISRSAREKTYSSFANHWRLGKPRHFVTLKTVYYLLSDKFCAFSVLDLLWNLTKGFVSFFQVSCLGLFKL